MDNCVHSLLLVHHAAKRGHNYQPSSLQAIRVCLEAGARVIEVDISPLADGDFLLFHNQRLEDGTDGSGLVAAQTASEVSHLHYTRAGCENAEPVGLLSQALELLRNHPNPVELQLDLKSHARYTDHLLMSLLRVVEPVKERIRVTSPADWAVRRLRSLDGDIPLGFDPMLYLNVGKAGERDPQIPPFRLGEYGYWDDHPLASRRWGKPAEYLAARAEALWLQAPSDAIWYIPAVTLDHAFNDGFDWIADLHERGAKVDAWTLDPDRSEHIVMAQRLSAAGVDRITTTNAPAMAAALNNHVLF
jgi:glycerophosphoryl diester phosphodiesterase